MTEVYVNEPEPARWDDYRYVASCAPSALKSLVVIEAGSDINAHEALSRLRDGLAELGIAPSGADLKVVDEAGLLEEPGPEEAAP